MAPQLVDWSLRTDSGLLRKEDNVNKSVVTQQVKILLCINTAWNVANFRIGLIAALQHAGYDVVAVAPADGHEARLACRFVSLPIDNGGTRPLRDALLLFRVVRLLRAERPNVFLGYTVKPNVYGSIACHWLGIPVINNIAGLGAAFVRTGWLTRVVSGLYRLALHRSAVVFFQNEDDRALFVAKRIVRAEQTVRLPGSGVDLLRFSVQPMPPFDALVPRPITFLLIARLLWDKGVGEFVQAARLLSGRGLNVRFQLLGFLEVKNPSAVARDQVDAWCAEGLVEYLGTTDDVRPHIAAADCVVLPSYREGVSRTLLEAAACGRPIVTTDTPGCRDVVEDGLTGLLCRVRDADDLAAKIEHMVEMGARARGEMGRHGRRKVEREFDEQLVIKMYLSAIEEVLSA